MRSNREPKRLSLGRLAFLCATAVAFVYSFYSLAVMFVTYAWPPAEIRSHNAGLIPLPAKPEEAELVGLWVPDEETATRLRGLSAAYAEGSASARLVLRKGSCELVEVPYFRKGGAPQVFRASWSGGWSLYRQHDTWAVYLPNEPVEARGLLYGEGRRYRMLLVVGDPLVNEPLWFVKKQG